MATLETKNDLQPLRDRKLPRGLAGIIFLKEFKEIFRDRRTLFGAVISPLLITPLLIWGSGQMITSQNKKEAASVYTIGVVNPDASPTIYSALEHTPNIRVEDVSRANADAMVSKRSIRVAVLIPENAERQLQSNETVPVTVLQDSGNDVSQSASDRISKSMSIFGDRVRNQRLQKQGLSPQFGTPIAVISQGIKGGGSAIMFALAMFIPYVLALSAFSGGMYAANDQIAGEKERGTLETLLVSPASRRDIVMGKFLAIVCVCALSGILSVLGLVIPFAVHGSGILPAGATGAIHLGAKPVATILLAEVLLAVFFAGILVAVSTFAKNQKEVQVYQAPMIMLILLPAMGSMFVTTEAPITMALIPVLNTTLVIKQTLSGVTDIPFLLAALASSVVYAAAALLLAVKLFENERVLLKT